MSSSDETRNAIRAARVFFRESEEVVRSAKTQHREYWRNAAGPLVESMLTSRIEAENCLASDEPLVRSAALSILCNEWNAGADGSFRDRVEQIAREDAATQVKALAITCLGSCYNGSGNIRIGKLLAEVVSDQSIADEIRIAAYSSLFALCGELDSNLELFLDFQFPENVDWAFVERFLKGNPPVAKADPISVRERLLAAILEIGTDRLGLPSPNVRAALESSDIATLHEIFRRVATFSSWTDMTSRE